MSDPPHSESGRVIGGRYQLQSVIGRGGAGTVWCARDEVLRRDVAVKEVHLPASLSASERGELRERVLREARSASAVRHPVLATVFDVVEDGGQPWLVLELIEGRTLGAMLGDRLLGPAEAARVGLDLLAALSAIHRAGIQHRDVKPGNVLIEPDGRPRLTDFGIASTVGDPALTRTGVLLGSPSYLPPERARGGPGGPESDLWALAATLYASVEGVPPYAGSHPIAVLTAVVEGRRRPAERAGDLGPLLADILDRAPEDRPDTDTVRRALLRVAGPDLPSRILDPARRVGVDVPVEAGDDRSARHPGGSHAAPTSAHATRLAVASPRAMSAGGTAGARLSRTSTFDAVEPAAVAAPSAPVPRVDTRPRRRLALPALAAVTLLLLGALGVFLLQSSTTGTAAPGGAVPAIGGTAGATTFDAVTGIPTASAAATPAGWVRYTDPAGWSVAHPADWRVTTLGRRGVDVVQPGTGSYLHVETSASAPSSVLDDWTEQEKLFAPRVSDYRRLQVSPGDGGDGSRVADWEFTFGLAGSPLHAADRGLTSGGTGYSLYWQTSAGSWDGSRSTLRDLYRSFAIG